jgi:hypothetical protein
MMASLGLSIDVDLPARCTAIVRRCSIAAMPSASWCEILMAGAEAITTVIACRSVMDGA